MKLLTIFFAIFSLFSCKDDSAAAKPKTVEVTNTTGATDIAKRGEIVAYAKTLLGTQYCYAGSSPDKGFDCSGFVNYVFKNFEIEVPRSSSGFADAGKTIKPEDIKVGDVLVFYGYRDSDSVGHVGIVTEANGMKSKFIHSSSGKEMAVMISDLGSDMYTKRFYKAVDVIGK
jgi:cell wall-associated NlpC family hydrolase